MEVLEREDVKDRLKEMLTYDNVEKLLSIVREINSYNGRFDDIDYWENDEEFFNCFFQCKPMEAARAVYYGDYNYMDDYVKFNAYGNLESANNFKLIDDFRDYIDDIAEEIERLQEEENYNLMEE